MPNENIDNNCLKGIKLKVVPIEPQQEGSSLVLTALLGDALNNFVGGGGGGGGRE